MSRQFLDVWNVDSYDAELLSALRSGQQLVLDHFRRSRECEEQYEAAKRRGPVLSRPKNDYGDDFARFRDSFIEKLAPRVIRGWHYTRLTADEVANLITVGIEPSTPDLLKRRLKIQIDVGNLTVEQADYLLEHSPYNHQTMNRTNMFWFTSHPLQVTDDDVSALVTYWGGEVASFSLDDDDRGGIVSFGCGRVLECHVPVSHLEKVQIYLLAEKVVLAFGYAIGARPDNTPLFDFNIKRPLAAEFIAQIHSEGDDLYDQIGVSYPSDLPGRYGE